MLNKQLILYPILLGLLVLETTPTVAQSHPPASDPTPRILTRVLFKPPPEDKKPHQTRAAGSRNEGRCPQDRDSSSTPLTPLVPSASFGLTTTERPTLWLMIPKTTARQVVLSIREEGIQYHSKTLIPITGESGVIGLQPSADAPPLATGKTYQWGVVLVCGKTPTPNDPSFAVWVKRVAIGNPPQHGSTLEQAAWYGNQGIWYDALTHLVKASQSQPNDPELKDIWHNFLQSGGILSNADEE